MIQGLGFRLTTVSDLRRYGSVPHADFGLGFEQLVSRQRQLCASVKHATAAPVSVAPGALCVVPAALVQQPQHRVRQRPCAPSSLAARKLLSPAEEAGNR